MANRSNSIAILTCSVACDRQPLQVSGRRAFDRHLPREANGICR